MPTPPILEASTIDWTYEDLTEELEHLALLEELESPAGPLLAEFPALFFDDEIARVAEDLGQVAELEGR
jgi:hypothetical protein